MNEFHRLIRCILACALLIVCAACTSIEVRKDEPVSSWVSRDSMKRKSEASARTVHDRIDGRPVKQFFHRHSAILSDGGMPMMVSTPGAGDDVRFAMPGSDGYGSAVALGDGYFLTAAHVPLKGHGGLFCMDKSGKPVVRSYRVVWTEKAADLAILHADVDTPGVKWAKDRSLANGAGIFTFGFGGGEWKPSQGQIISRGPTGDGNRHSDLKLSAPVVAGDSGGPVVTAAGELVGIVTRADYRWVRAFGRAWMRSGSHTTRPDIGMIEGIIAKDRASRKN
ncbi:serine protease [Luteolibacter flavescens]|uniref:Serine protease n=1 Tax=Luteolibacter flavescens TaxID=1859460 RepID=A0ABT3FJM5_9BACT|nr:serine protease [Luteolibacter flavescens]MCW1883559.1 serine protease [Luteolibacter flavescens]